MDRTLHKITCCRIFIWGGHQELGQYECGSLHCIIKNMKFRFRIRHVSEFTMLNTQLHKGIANVKLDHVLTNQFVNFECSVHFFRSLCFRKWRISKGFRSAKDIIHEVKNCFLTRCLARIVLSAPQSFDFNAKPLQYSNNC